MESNNHFNHTHNPNHQQVHAYVPHQGQASRGGIMHFSHKHSLCLVNLNAEGDHKACSGCERVISGPAYSCAESSCNFHLDNSCFHLPQHILHKSHPSHPLTLLPKSPYHGSNQFSCNACSKTGSGFTFHCATCEYDLHVSCASLTETVKRGDHQHPLQLIYSCPSKVQGHMFQCYVCRLFVPNNCSIYYCNQCDFGTHTECVNSEAFHHNPVNNPADQVAAAQFAADQLAAAEMAARISAKSNAIALKIFDPPGTTYKYKYSYI